MMFVLDTNVVSELRKVRAGKADRNVAAWCSTVDASVLFVSAITIMELETGVLQAERRDTEQGALSGHGLTGTCCPSSLGACYRSIPPSPNDAHGSMCRTGDPSGTRSLLRRRSCMA